jgi:predicted transcriptional regulator
MTDDVPKKSRGAKEKSMLDSLLEQWDMNYQGFSELLGIDYKTLWKYRTGKREFRLNWVQIVSLQRLLKQIGKDVTDLPSDWIRDKQAREEK